VSHSLDIADQRRDEMKRILAPTIAMAVGFASPVFSGMQGQGAHPDADMPEYEEQKPGG
jgi:hypothetical protein